MRLRSARQCYALWREAVVLRELEVDGRSRPIHVPVLGKIEVAQLGAEHGEHDILEVCIGAIGSFEWRGDETTRR